MVGVGASAGGVEALTAFVRALPERLDAAVFVVLHVSPAGTSALAQILDRAGPLPAVVARTGADVRAGMIFVAPPDRHVLVQDGTLQLSAGPKENGHRPAIDPTFRSLSAHGAQAVGIVLSGTGDDGTIGIRTIKAAGGGALVQDPGEAAYDGMIRSAMGAVDVDAALPVTGLAAALARLSSPEAMTAEPPAPYDASAAEDTRYTCPECGGHMSSERHGDVVRYRCEVGHAYSPASFDAEQANAVEGALWTAVRLLGDRSSLLSEMAVRADSAGNPRSAGVFRSRAGEADAAARAVRALLEDGAGYLTGGERLAHD
jgi:two-component system chemotaxis response regulator CheB